jgi:hypothetical protein
MNAMLEINLNKLVKLQIKYKGMFKPKQANKMKITEWINSIFKKQSYKIETIYCLISLSYIYISHCIINWKIEELFLKMIK